MGRLLCTKCLKNLVVGGFEIGHQYDEAFDEGSRIVMLDCDVGLKESAG